MSKHTNGRWVLTDAHRIVTEDGSLLATAWFPRKMPDADENRMPGESWLAARERMSPIREQIENESKANARLIAAAPELLAALIAARDYLSCIPESAAGGDDDAVRMCRDADYAIAKATGVKS